MFSPNSEQGACSHCNGLGHTLDCDVARLVTYPSRSLAGGAMGGHRTGRFYGDPRGQHMAILAAVGRALDVDFSQPWQALDERARQLAMKGAGERTFDVEWHYARGKRTGVHRFQSAWPGLQAYVRQEYERKHGDRRGEALEPLMVPVPCAACGGGKLKPEFLAVRFGGANIAELLARSVDETVGFFEALDRGSDATLDARTRSLTAAVRAEVVLRLRRLQDAALGYLTLDRPASTLSGGESQRVRLASQIATGLTGITYVLDEPTAGLHPRDTARLVGLLHALTAAGNTVVVVEHDEDVVRTADHVIEMGPGAGPLGGQIVSAGPAPAMMTGRRAAEQVKRRPFARGLSIKGAEVHNLRNLDVDVPAGGLVAVTGVSGSGKSSLVFDVLASSLERIAEGGSPVNCRSMDLDVRYAGVVTVNRGLAGSAWSTPATHIGVLDMLREWFAATDRATAAGLRAADFSTTTGGGRCEACEGAGQVRVYMDFLPDIWTTCERCEGRRYRQEVLECRVGERSIADVLEMTVDAADNWAAALPEGTPRLGDVRRRLGLLREVGLGYLRLGQATRTLSGGERQRLVLTAAIADDRAQQGAPHEADGSSAPPARRRTSDVGRRTMPLLYLLDEPTLGLHERDVAQLLRVFDRLIEAGHTVVVVEHNLDVIDHADWVIDMGPEGGPAGGRVMAAGPPETIAARPESYTGHALRVRAERNGESGFGTRL